MKLILDAQHWKRKENVIFREIDRSKENVEHYERSLYTIFRENVQKHFYVIFLREINC